MGVISTKIENIKINENKDKNQNFKLCCKATTLPSEREEDIDNHNNLNIHNNIGTVIFNYNYEDYNNNNLKEENTINFNIFSNDIRTEKTSVVELKFIPKFSQTSLKNESDNFISIPENMIKNDDFKIENNNSTIYNDSKIKTLNGFEQNCEKKDKIKTSNNKNDDYIEKNKKIKNKFKENKFNKEDSNLRDIKNDNTEFKSINFDINKTEEISFSNNNIDNKNEEKILNQKEEKTIKKLKKKKENDQITSLVSNMFEMFPNLKEVNNPIAIIYKSNLLKLINIPEKKSLERTVERFCIATKDNFFIFHSYESYLRVHPPLGILPINSIKSCSQFKTTKNSKFNHFFIQYELNDNTIDFFTRVNNFFLNENSKSEPIILFKSNNCYIARNWYILFNFFIHLEK